MSIEYVFVVGCFRSGTSLLVSILNSSKNISFIDVETKFLGGLLRSRVRDRIKKYGNLKNDTNLFKFVDDIYSEYSIDAKGLWRWLRIYIKRKEFLNKLIKTGRTEREIFKAILELHAKKNVKDNIVVGEKSPSHIYHVKTLIDWFPSCRIVHIIRDPRAVLISQLNRKEESYVNKFSHASIERIKVFFIFIEVLHVTAAWLKAASLNFKYKKKYPDKYTLIKYEDIILNPEKTVKKLCKFLEINYNPEMLDQKVINSSFTACYFGPNGFDVNTANRWKSIIKPWMKRWIDLFTYKYLEKFNYK